MLEPVSVGLKLTYIGGGHCPKPSPIPHSISFRLLLGFQNHLVGEIDPKNVVPLLSKEECLNSSVAAYV